MFIFVQQMRMLQPLSPCGPHELSVHSELTSRQLLCSSAEIAHLAAFFADDETKTCCTQERLTNARTFVVWVLLLQLKNQEKNQLARITHDTCTSRPPSQPSPSCCTPSLMGESANTATDKKTTNSITRAMRKVVRLSLLPPAED